MIQALQVEAVTYVLFNGAGEENGLLLDDGDLIVVPFRIELFDVASVEQNFSSDGVIKSLQERDNRGFSTTTGATKSYYTILLIVNGERNTLEYHYV
jgi:hypothetical protein